MKANHFQQRLRKSAKNEHCLQRKIVDWCRGFGRDVIRERFAAIPNGGARDRITGAKLKAEGVRAGMPDLIFWRDGGRVLWVEVKNGASGRMSPEQKDLHASMKADGHIVVVVRSLAEAIESVRFFYAMEGGDRE